ncbi:ferredoxin-thioredoxin reductase variable chain [Vacuolonema iberomarrocanum]|uniref:ferredoxin-thioredoxin reductase variable chain n=1 Tax=Vacuolonema iberomarrocanum TaxID=3454632 RepID=UPI0019E385EA|nr:ferredoxin-thioredoxin reductase variable chain [filamentous cyanobacterium LEGE 07170]
MKVGDRVRVSASVVVYHHPEHRGEAFDIKGEEGEIIGIVSEWKGKPISANFPVLVKFSKKFRAHLREDEVETVEATD